MHQDRPIRSLTPTSRQTNVFISSKSPITRAKPKDIFNNKFYNRFYKQQQTYHLLQKQVECDIKQQANSKKITNQSYRIVIKQLEDRITQAFYLAQVKESISFEQLGRLLTVLEVFQVVHFDQKCQLQQTEKFFSKAPSQQEQRILEMNLHDELWEVIAEDDEQELINSEQLSTVLRILLDPVKLSVEETIQLIYPVVQLVPNSKLQTPTSITNNCTIQQLKKLIDLFKKVQVRPIQESSIIQNKKIMKRDHIKQEKDKELTFKPKINQTSTILDQKMLERYIQESGIQRRPINQQISQALFGDESQDISNITHKVDRIELMLRKKAIQDELRAGKIKQKEDEDMRECTFNPSINYSTEESQCSTPNVKNLAQRMYHQEAIQNKRQFIEEFERERQIEKEEKELQKCTFHPIINDGILHDNEPIQPKDFDRNVGRLRYAHEQHQMKKHLLEYVPNGQGYEKSRNKPFNPPNMVNRQKEKRKPLLIMDINIAPGRSGRIALYPEESPRQVTRQFARMFSLNQEMEQTVLNVLITQKKLFEQKQ